MNNDFKIPYPWHWIIVAVLTGVLSPPLDGICSGSDDVATLRREVATQGWVVFAAHPAEIDRGQLIARKADRGQLDLYLARPDGTQLRNITKTAEFHEYGARFTPDGQHMLYRRLPSDSSINHDLWGATGSLVLADLDGSRPNVLGAPGEYPWASFGADMQQMACLYKGEEKIRLFDVASKKRVKEISSQGVFQQLFWAPDGKHLVGTANIEGRNWNVVSIDLKTGARTVLTRALNCTPDWFQSDPRRVIYSNRNPALFPGQYNGYGLTMLMQATVDGKHRQLIYGAPARHCYFGCTSPDDKYVIFCDDPHDGLIVGAIHVLRLSDTPIIPASFKTLKLLHPDSREGPILDWKLPSGAALRGFEPHWTDAVIGGHE